MKSVKFRSAVLLCVGLGFWLGVKNPPKPEKVNKKSIAAGTKKNDSNIAKETAYVVENPNTNLNIEENLLSHKLNTLFGAIESEDFKNPKNLNIILMTINKRLRQSLPEISPTAHGDQNYQREFVQRLLLLKSLTSLVKTEETEALLENFFIDYMQFETKPLLQRQALRSFISLDLDMDYKKRAELIGNAHSIARHLAGFSDAELIERAISSEPIR